MQFQQVTRCGCNLTIMPFVSFGHILDTAVINLDCVSVENSIYLPSISIKLKISDSVERIAGVPAFVTLKDHKDNLRFNPTCRLINPSKNEPEKVSKHIVEK